MLLSLDFDETPGAASGFEKSGGAVIVPQGQAGNVLKLPGREHAAVNAPAGFSARRGTISFRVRPLWGKEDNSSHTLLSMRWGDGRDSYLAISQGWWEPTGSGRLYFILSNQEIIHCSIPYALDTDSWTTVTVTWQAGDRGYCRLFVDGEKVAEHRAAFSGDYGPRSRLYLGSDRGSTVQRNRGSGFLLDDLRLFGRPLSEAEVLRGFEEEDRQPELTRLKKRRWLEELLEKGADTPLRRNGDGVALERRVMFDEDIRWATSQEETDRIIDRLKAGGFNVYVPCVWHGRGSAYPTKLAHPDSRLEKLLKTGHDPLAYLIRKAHAAGIEVHPWFTVVRREDGRYPRYFDGGTPENAFDVHNREFRDFVVALMVDVAARYPVDGINLDYLRSMGFCSCDRCVEEYRGKFGRSLREDVARCNLPGKGRDSLKEWNLEAVADIVRRFSARAKEIRPSLIVSVDAHPHNGDWLLQGQDSVGWQRSGWVDTVFAMDYRKKIDVEAMNRARAAFADPEAMTVLLSTYDLADRELVPRHERSWVTDYIGDKAVLARDPALLSGYVRLARRLWPGSGIAFYHYKRATDAQIRALKADVFREPALPCRTGDSGGGGSR
ncbi:MAG: family 10 glycosylhydrolase [Geobacteraceae bacterium]|nr:family 10 glycosylhydrolase [Geobacteraceae bacterium]